MGLYDVNFQNLGFGQISYPELSGETEINFYEDFRNAFNNNGIFPLTDFRDPTALLTGYGLFVCLQCFVKVTSSLQDFAFGSTPEARFKIGSFNYIKGYEVVVNPDNTISTFPYYGETQFLNYEREALPSAYFVSTPNDSFESAYPIDVTQTSPAATPAIVRQINPYFFGIFTQTFASGISLNLNNGITADMLFLYSYTTIQPVGDPDFPDIYFGF